MPSHAVSTLICVARHITPGQAPGSSETASNLARYQVMSQWTLKWWGERREEGMKEGGLNVSDSL